MVTKKVLKVKDTIIFQDLKVDCDTWTGVHNTTTTFMIKYIQILVGNRWKNIDQNKKKCRISTAIDKSLVFMIIILLFLT